MPPVKGSDKSSPESTSDTPKQRKRPGRVPVSCAECRRLKLRCDRKVPCETCTKRGCAALCPDGALITGGKGTRQAVADVEDLKNKIEVLTNRSKALEIALRTLQAAVSDNPHPLLVENSEGSASSSSPAVDITPPPLDDCPTIDSSAPVQDEEDLLDAFGTLTLGPRGEARFFGQTSRSEYLIHAPERLSTNDIRFPRLSKQLVDECNKELDVQCKTHEAGLEMMEYLPPLSKACQLCETFLEHGKYLWYPLPRKYLFDEIVGMVYQNYKDSSKCNIAATHQLALMWMVYALATLFDTNQAPYAVEAHEYYLLSRMSLRYAPPAHDTTLTAIQTMIYMTQYLEMSDCEPAHTQSHKAWMTIGHTVKLGHSIGLHMNSHRWRLDEAATAQRNRVFWQLFFQDTWLSYGFGRPPSINLSFVDCEMPQDPEVSEDQDKREVGFHLWTWQYTRFFQGINTTAFGAKSPPYPKVMEIDRRVRDFPVPASLRIQCGDREDPPPSTALIMQRLLGTFMKESTLLNLHRPYFSQALNGSPEDPLKHRYGPSVMAIYRSAWRIFTTARCAYKMIPGITARLGHLWSYTIAGSIVMCLLVVRAPSSTLAKSSLAELDKLSELFEEAANHSQIVSNNLDVVRKIHTQAHEAMNRMHAAEDTARIHSELDRLGGKTHLICPTEERRMVCGEAERRSVNGSMRTATFPPYEPPVQPENIHPTIVQDMRAFDVETFDPTTQVMINLDLPSTVFDPAQMDFSFPQFEFSPPAMSTGSGSMGTPMGMPGGSLGSTPEGWGEPALNGAAGSGAAGIPGGMNGHTNGHVPGMDPLASGPPVLDATWQAFVEQLGF
ncbi:fungal-specific transcription factor domain-containing protein [Cerioporus squamosus]|nr:fungal-specific transcription factor domain-containing protein [Cerioporus squamosus]